MPKPSTIEPDVELRDFLQGKIKVSDQEVTVYGDWERPTNKLPDDFVVCGLNGDVSGVGMNIQYASGYMMVNVYCKLKDNGSVKKNRINAILSTFEELIIDKNTENFHFKYESDRFITPTTPNQTSGYSVTSLNLRWTTNSNFNKKPEKP